MASLTIEKPDISQLIRQTNNNNNDNTNNVNSGTGGNGAEEQEEAPTSVHELISTLKTCVRLPPPPSS